MYFKLLEINRLYNQLILGSNFQNIKEIQRVCYLIETQLKMLPVTHFNFELEYSIKMDSIVAKCDPKFDHLIYKLPHFLYTYYNPEGVFLLEKMAMSTL